LQGSPFSKLKPFKEMRNIISHQGAQTLATRQGDKFDPGDEVPITSEDVKNCMDLVQKCCDNIHERYRVVALPSLEETKKLQDAFDPFEHLK
jgi:hypothetical protein